jgi:hypothetical protein
MIEATKRALKQMIEENKFVLKEASPFRNFSEIPP